MVPLDCIIIGALVEAFSSTLSFVMFLPLRKHALHNPPLFSFDCPAWHLQHFGMIVDIRSSYIQRQYSAILI